MTQAISRYWMLSPGELIAQAKTSPDPLTQALGAQLHVAMAAIVVVENIAQRLERNLNRAQITSADRVARDALASIEDILVTVGDFAQ